MSEDNVQDGIKEEVNEFIFSNDDSSDSKTYRLSKKVIKYFKEQMDEKNLTQSEFFNLIANELKKNNILEHASGVSNELRRNFDTDVRRLREATDSIMFIFMNQMKHILVEKEKWLQDKDSILQTVKRLEGELNDSRNEVQALQDSLQQNEDNFVTLERDLQEKIADKEKLLAEKDSRINDKDERNKSLEQELIETKKTFNDERNNLNTRIVELLGEVKKFEPIKAEKVTLEKEIDGYKDNVEKLEDQIKSLKEKQLYELNNLKTTHEVDIKSSVLDTETKIRAELNAAIEEYRSESRELYDKVDKLRDEKSNLLTEVAHLREEVQRLRNKGPIE